MARKAMIAATIRSGHLLLKLRVKIPAMMVITLLMASFRLQSQTDFWLLPPSLNLNNIALTRKFIAKARIEISIMMFALGISSRLTR